MKHPRFTLVEVLIALLVTAVVVPIALRALMTVGMLDQSANQHRQVAHLAELKLQELVVTGDWLEADTSGDFGDDYPGFRWELATDDWDANKVTMTELSLTAFGPGRGREQVFTLTTLVTE